ncbi:hypothetical protein MXD59_21415 [Frankia sp. Ag45/Mut15]|uniref:Uncharacterized protein n=1 Tax=Frankia umida TaxID=573489 RepID=A0ABT0K4Q6_9ACTN|nr:hypothetical protein [Frankia umida]MCK9878298.1 hypothetical protein [Frankia umida]
MSERATRMLRVLAARLLLVHLTLSAHVVDRLRPGADPGERDRGDGGLSTALIAAGLVLIAAVVIFYLRQKATQIASNVCTSTDPAQCQQQ